MPRLTKSKIQNAIKMVKDSGKGTELSDGGGLFLRLQKSYPEIGQWVLYTSINRQRKRMHLGHYNHLDQNVGMSIDQARSLAFKTKTEAKINGYAVSAMAIGTTELANTIPSIESFIADYFEQTTTNKSVTTKRNLKVTKDFLQYAKFLKNDIDQLSMQLIAKPLAKYSKGKHSIALSVCKTLNRITKLANQMFDTPARRFNANVIATSPSVRSHEPMDMEALNAWLVSLAESKDKELAQRLLICLLTLCRHKEACFISADTLDHKHNCIRIPAEAMKAKREHLVPLTPLLSELVSDQTKQITYDRTRRLFAKTRPDSRYTVHGFRALGATVLHEICYESPDIVERCLAHQTMTKVQTAYNRYNYLKEMYAVKEKWEQYLLENTSIRATMDALLGKEL